MAGRTSWSPMIRCVISVFITWPGRMVRAFLQEIGLAAGIGYAADGPHGAMGVDWGIDVRSGGEFDRQFHQ